MSLINPPRIKLVSLLRKIFEISEEDILKSSPPFKWKFSWIHCLICKIFLGASPPDPQFFNDIYMGGLRGGAPQEKIANLGAILSFFHQKNID